MTRSDYIFFWAAIAFVVLGIVAKIFVAMQEAGSPKKYLINRKFHLLMTTGLLVLLWTGFRYEVVPWFSTHIVVLSLWLIAAVWMGFIVAFYFRHFRHQQKLWNEEKIKRKYLPR